MDELRRYELFVVFQPELDDEQLEARIERVNGYLTNSKGEIVEVVRRGKRRLAYPIRKFTLGIDVVYQMNFPSRRLEVLERQLNLNEDVIRYLVVRREELEGEERLTATKEEIAAEVAALHVLPTEVDAREGFDLPGVTAQPTPTDTPVVPSTDLVGESVSATPADATE